MAQTKKHRPYTKRGSKVKNVIGKGKLKKCIMRLKWKHISLFHKEKNSFDKRAAYCKNCAKLHSKMWRKLNRIKHCNYSKEYTKTHIEQVKTYKKNYRRKFKRKIKLSSRDAHLKYNYGISHNDYLKMLRKQKYCCPICGLHGRKLKWKPSDPLLVIDHNHVTKKVRGLVCNGCNHLLGFLDADNIKIAFNKLRGVIKYLGLEGKIRLYGAI